MSMFGNVLGAGAEWLIKENQRPGSPDSIKHWQPIRRGHGPFPGRRGSGGQAGRTAPVQDVGHGRAGSLLELPLSLKGPALFVSGSLDLIVMPLIVEALYGLAPAPKIYAKAGGASTRPTLAISVSPADTSRNRSPPNLGDENARGMFYGTDTQCRICKDNKWAEVWRDGMD